MSPICSGLKCAVGFAVGLVLVSYCLSAAAQVCGATCAEPEPPSVDCHTGCDRYLSGRGHRQVNAGEVACIQRGKFLNGAVNVNGGELRVCGTAALRYANVDGGNLTVLGRARVVSLNSNSRVSTVENYGWLNVTYVGLQGSLENHGAMTIVGALDVGPHAAIYNASDLVVEASLKNAGTFDNAGSLAVRGSLYNKAKGSLSNACSATVTGHASIGGTVNNTGLLSVGGTVTVNNELQLGAYSQVQTRDLTIHGTVVGQYNDCSSIAVDGKTIIEGSIEEMVDVCDANGIEGIKGTLGYQVTTDCSCDPSLAESLVLFDVQPAEVERLACADSLRSLTIYDSSFTSLEGFPNLANLESLYVGSAGLTTLAGLPSLRRLTELSVEHNDLTDLDSMPSLPALRVLYAGDNPIVDALGLSATPALQWLDLYNTEIASIANVAPLADLRTLLLDHDFKGPHESWAYLLLNDLEALIEFPRLERLDLSGRLLTSLTGFPAMNELRYLHLDNNELADLADLPPQPALELLTLYNNPVNGDHVTDQAVVLGLELCSYLELKLPGQCY